MKREIFCHCHLVTPGAEIADAAMGALLEPLRVWAEEQGGLTAVTDRALGLLVATLRDIAKIAGQVQAERKALRRAAR